MAIPGRIGPGQLGEAKTGSRRYYTKRFEILKEQRQLFLDHWLDLADFVLPRSGRFRGVLEDMGNPKRNDYSLLNNTGTVALEALRALLVTGITPPARPWLRFRIKDDALAEIAENKEWVDLAEKAFFQTINESNFYSIMPSVYEEVALFGTSALEIVRHPQKIIGFNLLTAGQYVAATDIYNQVNTVFYEDVMTVEQIYQAYVIPEENREEAESRLSQQVREYWRKGEVDQRFKIIKGIFPNDESEDVRLKARASGENSDFPFKGVAFQEDRPGKMDQSNDQILKVSYYKYMPILVPRWHLNPGDTYGRSPGMTALGDIKMLQSMERNKLEIIEKLANPPLVAQTDSLEGRIMQNAGEVTYTPGFGGSAGDMVKPLVDMRTNAAELGNEIYRVEERIRLALHGNLTRNIEGLRPPPGQPGQSKNITATEVNARERERLLQLSPIMERFDTDLLDPLATLIVSRLVEENIIPPAPEDLQGAGLRIEFLNIVAAAQRDQSSKGAIDLINFVAQFAELPPFDVMVTKLKIPEAIEEIAAGMDVPQKIMVSLQEMREASEAMRTQQEMQAKMAQAQQLADLAGSAGSITGSGGRPVSQNMLEGEDNVAG